MTELDDRLVPRVKELVERYGAPAAFRVPGSKEYDPDAGQTVEADAQDVQARITPPEPYRHGFVRDDLVKEGDLKTYVAASGLGFTPTSGMKVTFGGVAWRAEHVSAIYTGEQVALYELLLRR